MHFDIASFAAGAVLGGIAVALIYHNNKAKADKMIDAASSAAQSAETAAGKAADLVKKI